MALSQEQFNQLRNRGLSVEQIIQFEKGDIKASEAPSPKAGREKRRFETPEGLIEGSPLDVGIGVAKSIGSTVRGIGEFGERTANLFTKGRFSPNEESIYNKNSEVGRRVVEALSAKNQAQGLGKFTGDVAQFAIPGTAAVKATKGAGLGTKLLTRGLTSGSVATAQQGDIGAETGVAVGAEALFPLGGAASRLFGRVFKNLGAGLSGVGVDLLDSIRTNPQQAKQVLKEISESGQEKVLEKNAKTIIKGVQKVRKDARKAFGKGLDELQSTDIDQTAFRQSIQPTLDDYGIETIQETGERILKNVEFDEPKNIQKASDLIDELSRVEFNGKSLRKLLRKIEDSKFRTATTDERLSYNAFIDDLAKGVRDAITDSTDKLDEINKAFSTDIQLAEAIEGVFGKVKFTSLNELRKTSEKLETLFSKRGLTPKIIDDFLRKTGVDPVEFRTSEAVRQIGEREVQRQQVGSSLGELLRVFTTSGVTPEAVRDLSIRTGIAQESLTPILNRLAPAARATFIKGLVEGTEFISE